MLPLTGTPVMITMVTMMNFDDDDEFMIEKKRKEKKIKNLLCGQLWTAPWTMDIYFENPQSILHFHI